MDGRFIHKIEFNLHWSFRSTVVRRLVSLQSARFFFSGPSVTKFFSFMNFFYSFLKRVNLENMNFQDMRQGPSLSLPPPNFIYNWFAVFPHHGRSDGEICFRTRGVSFKPRFPNNVLLESLFLNQNVSFDLKDAEEGGFLNADDTFRE